MVATASPREVLVQISALEKRYNVRRSFAESLRSDKQSTVQAVAGIDLAIYRGESLGLVGQSGCGKSTLGQLITRLEQVSAGAITVNGTDIVHLKGRALKQFRRQAQIIFQDPYESLNPRYRIDRALLEPLAIHGIGRDHAERTAIIAHKLEQAGLRPADKYLYKYPHELSGGERQRVAIARAIVVDPQFIVADEPVSMLDVSVRAGILNLLRKLQAELHMTYLFITHDLAVARYMCDRIAIMYFGHIVEIGPTEAVLHNPQHAYTRHLISAVPVPDPSLVRPEPPALRREELLPQRDGQLAQMQAVGPDHFVLMPA